MAKLAVLKTMQNVWSVAHFLDNIDDDQKRIDSQVILKMMEKATKEKPKMWGASIMALAN